MTQTSLNSAATRCAQCGTPFPAGALVCAQCGRFVHLDRLNQLAAEATGMEPINPWAAVTLWQQCLALIPTDSQQASSVRQRIGMLSAGMMPPAPAASPQRASNATPRRPQRDDPLSIALLKTIGSMALSVVVYSWLFRELGQPANMEFAAAFVGLMLVHELGHVAANKYYGLSASPPIFIPFLGAVINLRQRPPNAKAEAMVGIGGPVTGTIGSLLVYFYALQSHSELSLAAAHFGFLLNLFNLLPVPPLDGGRVTAAISPWIWMLGIAGLIWLFVTDLRDGHSNYILVMVLVYAFPRIKATLQSRGQFGDYYKISRVASWSIAAAYLVLGLSLLFLYQKTKLEGFSGF